MSEELRARDLLRTLPVRAVVGDRLVLRVGGRGWNPPRFAKGRRLFERCGLPDPWDPDAVDTPVALGDVGLAARKVVAPHATAPGTSTAAPPPWVGQRSSPTASATPAPRAPNLPPSRPAAKPPPTPPPRPAVFGAPSSRPALAKLPVRPDLDPAKAAPRPGGGGSRPAEPPRAPAPPRPVAPEPRGPRFAAVPRPARGVDGPEEIVVVEVPEPLPPPEAPPPAPAPAARVPASANLDDLFGMGEGTRVRLAPPPAADTPRRARVTDASQVQGGVDRRPPLVKKDEPGGA